MCTINKSAHTKNVWKLFNDPPMCVCIYIYIYITIRKKSGNLFNDPRILISVK